MSIRWAFMERFEVPDLDEPDRLYLSRLRIIQTPWFGVYLHRFDGPDSRDTLHDHPWPFVSVILRGGYVEYRLYPEHGGLPHHVRRLNVKRASDTHYIERLDRTPSYSLMLVGRRQREWGYVDRDGTWTKYDEHLHGREFRAAMAARKTSTKETHETSPAHPRRRRRARGRRLRHPG